MDAKDLAPCRASHEGMALVTVWNRATQLRLAEIIADAINRAAAP